MRAAVYLRISQDATGEQAGVTRQREDCIALVEQQGWTLHEIYVDNDISASSGKARPGYKRMLADITDGQVDAVVAWHPDRLYRKLASLEELIAACERQNVVMRTVRAGEIDLSTPTGRMLARILSATAQAEGEVKADRWRRSWQQGREAGKPAKTGSRLFGYTHDGDIEPTEAAIARRMADDLLAGISLHEIGRRLDNEGIRTTRDSVWRTTTIRQYLSNPRIAGWSTLKGEIVAEGTWEPILDRETWESIRALVESRTKSAPYRKSLLGGLVHCAAPIPGAEPGTVCGTRMLTSNARGKRTYRCSDRPGWQDSRGCGQLSINAEPVEEIVEEYAKLRLDIPEVRAGLQAVHAGPSEIPAEIANLELRIGELERQLDEPGIPIQTILRAIDRAKDRQASLLASLGALPRVALPASPADWPHDLRRRRALVDYVVGRVDIMPATGGNRFNEERVQIIPR